MVHDPETYTLKANEYAPNNPLPVLVYRDCLPLPFTEENTTAFLESHAWLKGGTWGHIPVRHFHPNTHECYGTCTMSVSLQFDLPLTSPAKGIFQGSSILLLGCGASDTSGGQEVEVQAGDVIVLPAGTAHCNLQSSTDYRYIGVYPEGAPHWRNELGKKAIDLETLQTEINQVARPAQDPVNGLNGPLIRLW